MRSVMTKRAEIILVTTYFMNTILFSRQTTYFMYMNLLLLTQLLQNWKGISVLKGMETGRIATVAWGEPGFEPEETKCLCVSPGSSPMYQFNPQIQIYPVRQCNLPLVLKKQGRIHKPTLVANR